jgi:outer membrane receptor protein involved in Fe transport
MIKRALPVVLGLFSLCLPLVAQETDEEIITREQLQVAGTPDAGSALALYRPDLFSTVDGSILIHGLPALTLLDGRRFPISSELGRMGMTPLDIFPVAFLNSVAVEKVSPSPMKGTDYPGGVVDLRLNRNYSGGEIGIFYGKSGGRYGREDFEAYMVGGVGNDKFHITVGAAYEESSGKLPRFNR